MAINRSLTMLVHGASKAGKSTISATTPVPRLILDVEHGSRFLPITAVYWDPKTQKPPVYDGTWDTCVVPILAYADMMAAYQYLKLGKHPFKSVVIDSISELQVKLIDQLVGTDQIKMQQWGELLRGIGDMMRGLRDLTMHPTNPLDSVLLTAMTKELNGKYKPYLQGSAAVLLPYLWDVVGYLRVEEWPNPDPTQLPLKLRRMYIEATDFCEAGERVQGRLGAIVEQDNLNIVEMIDRIYGPVATVAAATTTTTTE